MRARLQRNRVIRCRLGHEAAAKPVIHSREGPALLCHLRSHATAHRQTPKQLSKPPEGTVGAAPLSKSEMAVGLQHSQSSFEPACRGSVFGLLAAAVWVALAGAAFAFGAASGAAWPRRQPLSCACARSSELEPRRADAYSFGVGTSGYHPTLETHLDCPHAVSYSRAGDQS